MKMVIAYVQPFMASHVVHALHQVPGVSGASFVRVRGFGRGRSREGPTPEVLLDGADRVRVEVMVSDDLEDLVVRTIRQAAHTGNSGDGKVYVAELRRAVRIATGEEGDRAI